MTIILTEKPSVARDFAKALSVPFKKDDGYYQSNNYIIVNALGHLLEAKKPDEIDIKYKHWRLEHLPILPDELSFAPVTKVKKQLTVIKTVLKDVKYDSFIVATDAGREGELIARLIIEHCKVKDISNFKRFWVSEALSPKVIKQGLSKLEPLANYNKLYQEGLTRQYSDWLIGMNYSRFFTLKCGTGMSIGRVQSCVLNAITERQKTIESFKPSDYFQLEVIASKDKNELKGFVYKGEPLSNSFDNKELVEQLKASFGKTITISNITETDKSIAPPLLYSLTALQKEANTKLGFSADKTLKIAQKLYEEYKCLSYPRTPSSVMGEGNACLVKEKVELLAKSYPKLFSGIDNKLIDVSNKRVFNNAKLEDHHALIPLKPIPSEASSDEVDLYELVLTRFASIFHSNYQYKERVVSCKHQESVVQFKGRQVISLGWQTLYKQDDSDNEQALPPLNEDDNLTIDDLKLLSKKTKPPALYNEATILAFMENPRALIEDTELKIHGIGTPATRADIIEGLLGNGYIERKTKNLLATDKGFFLIEQVSKTACRELFNPITTRLS
jgi:DNA topoisomerase-3